MKRKIYTYLSIILLILIPTIISNISNSFSTKNSEETTSYLNDSIIKNNTVLKEESEPGLYQEENIYYFKGNVINNYLKINNDLWRIIIINEDNTIKLIKDKPFNDNKYIVNEDYTNENYINSIIYQELEKYYDNELKSINNIIKTEYCTKYNNECLETKENYISLITEKELKKTIIEENNLTFINNKDFWIMSNNYLDPEINQAYLGYYSDNEIIDKTFVDDEKYIVPVITLDKNTQIKGTGLENDPYIIIK